jgi:hypothetical protein
VFPVRLFGSIGLDEENDSDDVASVGNSLVDLGLDGARDAADTGAWDNHFDSSVKSFQERKGLDVDGVLYPGGPTEAALNQSLELRRGAHKALGSRFEQQFDVPRGFSSEKALVAEESNTAIPRQTFGSRRHEQGVWEGADLPRISDGAARVIAESSRQSKTPLDNFLRLLDRQPIRGALPEAAAISTVPSSDEVERVLTTRGYRYVPDPVGRIGWGDWIDAEGKALDEKHKHAIVTRESAFGNSASAQFERLGEASSSQSQDGTETTPRALRGLNNAQSAVLARSDLGVRLAEAQNRITESAFAHGEVPASVWNDELRKLGIEPGQIGAPASGVTLVQQPGDQKEATPDKKRTPQTFAGKAWSWLTEEIPGLAEEKAQTIDRLNADIRAIQSKPGWRGNIASLYALQSLYEARTGIIGGYPTSRLDFILSGIDVIGVGMVGGRPLTILRKGDKIITSADLAEGGFRSRQALDLGKDVPYDSHLIRTWLERRFGSGVVTSTTIPSADYRFIQLAGKRHPVTGIVFDTRGYPIFDDVARFDTRIPSEVFWKGRIDVHKQTATLQLREAIDLGQIRRDLFSLEQLKAIQMGKSDIPGYRWHHHQDLGRMQLVPELIHARTSHLGGTGLRKGQ